MGLPILPVSTGKDMDVYALNAVVNPFVGFV